MTEFSRFVNPDVSSKEATALLLSELSAKGVEVTMCIKCGELVVKLTRPEREITEHICQQ